MLNTLASKLRDIREQNEMTQVELANLSGITRSYISDIENGKANQVTISMITRLANTLGVQPIELLGGAPTNDWMVDSIRSLSARDRLMIENLLVSMSGDNGKS